MYVCVCMYRFFYYHAVTSSTNGFVMLWKVHMDIACVYTCIHVRRYMRLTTNFYSCICVHVHERMFLHVSRYTTQIFVCINVHIYIHIHTHVYPQCTEDMSNCWPVVSYRIEPNDNAKIGLTFAHRCAAHKRLVKIPST
jgi:hypothetical protein